MSKTQFERVWGYIEAGKAEGAKVVLGGEKRNTGGYWVDPTSRIGVLTAAICTEMKAVFADVKPSMKIVREEVRCLTRMEIVLYVVELTPARADIRARPGGGEIFDGGRGNRACERYIVRSGRRSTLK